MVYLINVLQKDQHKTATCFCAQADRTKQSAVTTQAVHVYVLKEY